MVEQNQEPKEPMLTDVGTRYEHLMDLLGLIELVMNRLKEREVLTPDQIQKLFEFAVASQFLKATIDSMSGYNGYMEEYKLYQTLNRIPENPEEIKGGRGTPLV